MHYFIQAEPRCFSISSFVNKWFKEHPIPQIDLSTNIFKSCVWFAEGKYSDVYKVKTLDDKERVLKVFRKFMTLSSKIREISILLRAVELGVAPRVHQIYSLSDNGHDLCILQDRVHITLNGWMNSVDVFTANDQTLFEAIVQKILSQARTMWTGNIVHGDLKSDNIGLWVTDEPHGGEITTSTFFNQDGSMKPFQVTIFDYGLAAMKQTQSNNLMCLIPNKDSVYGTVYKSYPVRQNKYHDVRLLIACIYHAVAHETCNAQFSTSLNRVFCIICEDIVNQYMALHNPIRVILSTQDANQQSWAIVSVNEHKITLALDNDHKIRKSKRYRGKMYHWVDDEGSKHHNTSRWGLPVGCVVKKIPRVYENNIDITSMDLLKQIPWDSWFWYKEVYYIEHPRLGTWLNP